MFLTSIVCPLSRISFLRVKASYHKTLTSALLTTCRLQSAPCTSCPAAFTFRRSYSSAKIEEVFNNTQILILDVY